MTIRQSQNVFKKISILIILAMLISFFSFKPIVIKAAAGSNNLQEGEYLTTGQRITSSNGLYFALMQSDGNFVIYNNNNQALWHTHTYGHNYYQNLAYMQTDGNFVVYGGNSTYYNSSFTVLYNADTYKYGSGNYQLVMRDDSVLEVTKNGSRVWASTNAPIAPNSYASLRWQWVFRGTNPYRNINQKYSSKHLAIDSNAPAETQIYSVTSGTVIAEGYNKTMGYYVVTTANTTYNGNTLTTRYMHMSARSDLQVKNRVTSNTTIGKVGTTGDSTGNHLHFDVNTLNTPWGDHLTISNTIDPLNFFPNVTFTYNS